MAGGSDCGRARRVLWPDAGPRPATAAVADAHAHLAECSGCASFFAEMATIVSALRAQASLVVAPVEVRDRLFRTLARERAGASGRPGRRIWWAMGAAAALVLFALAHLLVSSRREEAADFMRSVVVEHTTAMSGERLVSSDRDSVMSWLSQRVPFAVDVPVLTSTRLRGARLVVIAGRRGAVVEYETTGVPVSYYVVPAEGPGGTYTAAFPALRRGEAAGYPVVLWRTRAAVHAFVGNVPLARLERFARECIEQARTA